MVNLTNQRFGKLTVVEKTDCDKHGALQWKCNCDCGNTTVVRGYDLKKGSTKSCGCTKSGYSKTRLNAIYRGMKSRCYNKKRKIYKNYGGRGISVCEEWLGEDGFANFQKWALDNGYREELSIERKNNNGHYEPSNCRWATPSEQQNNKRDTRYVTIEDATKPISVWAKESGVNASTIRSRIKMGWEETYLLLPKGSNSSKKINRDIRK